MDCEKFEPLLLDELYDELDELTSAAVKKHVATCGRCGSVLIGFKSTRRAIDLPLVPVPAGLEDRILAAAKEAQKVVPIKSRMARALSVAERWAMRPQTAMAAVFLLMIGTSAFLIRSKNYARKDVPVSVTVEGAPSPTTVAQTDESLDDKAAAAAHGPSTSNITRPPVAQPSPVAAADNNNGPVDRLTAGAAHDKDDGVLGSLGEKDPSAKREVAPGAAAPGPAPTTAANNYAPSNAGPLAGAGWGSQQAAPPIANKRSGDGDQADPFSLGSAAFRARNYAEAARQFDIAAQGGDMNAALWAAESTREGKGCAVALGRFIDVSQKASGTYTGDEASLKAARCQMNMGQLDPARDRLNKLASSGSTQHQQQAHAALAELNQIAAAKASGGSGAAAGAAAAPKRPAPARAASPARAPSETMEKKKAVDSKAYGY